MKIKLTNYDASNYKLFEAKLNDLSKQGYNCSSADLFTFFKHDKKRYYYKTAIFVPNKKSSLKARQQREQWMLNYVDHGYKFIGKAKKIYIFKADKDIKIKETDPELLLTYFKKNKTLLNILSIFISLFLSFLLIPSVFTNRSPTEYVTNGAILIHYAPLILCSSLLLRFFINYLHTEKIKTTLIEHKNLPTSKSHEFSFILSNWLFIISFFIIIAGFGLDIFERKTLPITDQILSLNDLGYSSKRSPTYVRSSSLLIKEAYSYFESNNDQALNVNYYRFTSNKQARKNIDYYLQTNQYQKKKQIAKGYLLANEEMYNNLIFVKDKQLIVISTTFDLLKDELYQKIIDFYR